MTRPFEGSLARRNEPAAPRGQEVGAGRQEREQMAAFYQTLKNIREEFGKRCKAKIHEAEMEHAPRIMGDSRNIEALMEQARRKRMAQQIRLREEAAELNEMVRVIEYHMDALRPGLGLIKKYDDEPLVANHEQVTATFLPDEIGMTIRDVEQAKGWLKTIVEGHYDPTNARNELAGFEAKLHALKYLAEKEGIDVQEIEQSLRKDQTTNTMGRMEAIVAQPAQRHEWKPGPDGRLELPNFQDYPPGTTFVMTSQRGNRYTLTAAANQGPYRWDIRREGQPLSPTGEMFVLAPIVDPSTGESMIQVHTPGSQFITLRTIARIDLLPGNSASRPTQAAHRGNDQNRTRVGF